MTSSDCDLTLRKQRFINVPKKHYGSHVKCEWTNDPSMVSHVYSTPIVINYVIVYPVTFV